MRYHLFYCTRQKNTMKKHARKSQTALKKNSHELGGHDDQGFLRVRLFRQSNFG